MFTIHRSNISSSSHIRGDSGIFHVLNGILISFIILLIVYVTYELVFITKEDERMSKKSSMVFENTIPEESLSFSEPQPFSYYASQLEKRDIFHFPQPPVPQMENTVKTEVVIVPQNVPNLMDLKNLNLVGIVLDQYPTAIVEDQQSKETLFLHIGDQINEAVVEQIKKSKVIFNFHGQRVELTQ